MLVPESKAADGAVTNDTKLNYEVRGDGIVIGGVWKLAVPTNTTGALVIPETVNGKPVREIGMGAFAGCRRITAVTIPSGVKTISAHAFRGCTGLESVTIPESVSRIDAQAFDGCSKLKSLTLPQSLKDLRGYSFRGCKALTSVTIPAGVATIEEGAFDGCCGLKSVAIPMGVKNLGKFAFRGCEKLESVTIPEGVIKIEDGVFRSCNSLSSVVIPEGVVSIEGDAFNDCKKLTELTIPSTVKKISVHSFSHCFGLKDVRVADGNQFFKCKNGLLMTKDGTGLVRAFNVAGDVTIPAGVSNIWPFAFCDICPELKSVMIPTSVTSIGAWAFANCGRLTSVKIPKCVEALYAGTFYGTGLKSVTIPENVKTINGTFARCNELKSVTISQCVTNIVTGSFGGCGRLEYFYVDSGNPAYRSINGMLCSKDGSSLVYGVNGEVSIPNGVKSIGPGAFGEFYGLKTLTIPSSVTHIDATTFKYIDYNGNLTTVSMLGERPTCPDGTFSKCPKLKEIHVPANAKSWAGMKEWQGKKLVFDVKTDDSKVAANNPNQMAATVAAKAVIRQEKIGSYTWSYCMSDGKATIVAEKDGKPICAVAPAPKGHVTIPATIKDAKVTSIGENAFAGCKELTSVIIPDGVTNISASAFFGCNGLKVLTIPASVKSIGGWAFWFTGLESVTIPEGVTAIGRAAFQRCENLKAAMIPSSVSHIDAQAFWCAGLESMTIPASVKKIGHGAFHECKDLKMVTMLGERPETPVNDVFDACKKLTAIHVPASAKSWAGMKEWQGKPLVFDAKAE